PKLIKDKCSSKIFSSENIQAPPKAQKFEKRLPGPNLEEPSRLPVRLMKYFLSQFTPIRPKMAAYLYSELSCLNTLTWSAASIFFIKDSLVYPDPCIPK